MSILTTAFLALAMLFSVVNGQIEDSTGDDLCSCSPTVFSFTLDFEGTCPGNLVDDDGDPINDAIENVSCDALVLSNDQSNLIPTVIDAIRILELNADAVINQTTLEGPFDDGDVIEYASISSNKNLTETYFPFGLQLVLTGENSDGTTVINVVAIDYDTSECGEWPIFPSDASVGWVDIVSFMWPIYSYVLLRNYEACSWYLRGIILTLYRTRSRLPCRDTVLKHPTSPRQRNPLARQQSLQLKPRQKLPPRLLKPKRVLKLPPRRKLLKLKRPRKLRSQPLKLKLRRKLPQQPLKHL
jgi:hypothetical protein